MSMSKQAVVQNNKFQIAIACCMIPEPSMLFKQKILHVFLKPIAYQSILLYKVTNLWKVIEYSILYYQLFEHVTIIIFPNLCYIYFIKKVGYLTSEFSFK